MFIAGCTFDADILGAYRDFLFKMNPLVFIGRYRLAEVKGIDVVCRRAIAHHERLCVSCIIVLVIERQIGAGGCPGYSGRDEILRTTCLHCIEGHARITIASCYRIRASASHFVAVLELPSVVSFLKALKQVVFFGRLSICQLIVVAVACPFDSGIVHAPIHFNIIGRGVGIGEHFGLCPARLSFVFICGARDSVYLKQIVLITFQAFNVVGTRSIIHNLPFRLAAIDADIVDDYVKLVLTFVAEGDIAHLALVCTQVDAYLRPCGGGIAG